MTRLLGVLLGHVAIATIAVSALRASVFGIVASLALVFLARAMIGRSTDA
jgi:hypothetical protein